MRSSEEKLLLLLEAKTPMNILHPQIARMLTPDHRDADGVGWVSHRAVAKVMDGGEFKQVLKEILNTNLEALQRTDNADDDYVEHNSKYKDK